MYLLSLCNDIHNDVTFFVLYKLQVILHLDHARDEVTVHALAVLSMLLHFGNQQAQQEIGTLSRQHHTQMFSRMHKLLTTASSALLGER